MYQRLGPAVRDGLPDRAMPSVRLRIRRRFIALVAGIACSAGTARAVAAQIDYRNLDDDRPGVIEDAYPVEHYAFEVQAPYRFIRDAQGGELHLSSPELSYGIAANADIGIDLPFATWHDPAGPRRSGLAGPRVFGFYNFNTEGPLLPAVALRTDVSVGAGALGGQSTRVAIKAIATRSWGATRFHVNVARGYGPETGLAIVEPVDRWTYGAAVDHTFFRSSVLAVGEIYVRQATTGAPSEVDAGAGLRYQWSATTVLDAGVERRLRAGIGPDVALTVGLSHAFAIAGLMPRGHSPI